MRTFLLNSISLAVLTLAAGCASPKAVADNDAFIPDDQVHASQRLAYVQSAVGARADATLNECHFDGAGLNSLGRAKLDLMIRDNDAALPLVVYLNIAGETRGRRQSVESYLGTECHLLASQMQLKHGPNPRSLYPAAAGVADLAKLNTPSGDSGSAGAAPSGSGAKSGDSGGLLGGDSSKK